MTGDAILERARRQESQLPFRIVSQPLLGMLEAVLEERVAPVHPGVDDVDGHVLTKPTLQRPAGEVVGERVEDGGVLVRAPLEPGLAERQEGDDE